MKQQLVDKSSRIEVVDALRGFAVMAILLVHNLEHFIFPVYPENSPGWLKKQGKDFGYRFLWRLALLGVFATWNAAFFPAGDVLLLFVVVGVVLFLTRSWSDRAIGVAAVVLLLQPVEWYHYIANLINPAHRLPDLKVAEMYGEVADYTKAGNWRDFLLGNVTLGQKASFLWAVNAGRFVQTAGLFLLGFFIGRKQLFMTNEKNIAFGTKVLIISAISYYAIPFIDNDYIRYFRLLIHILHCPCQVGLVKISKIRILFQQIPDHTFPNQRNHFFYCITLA